MTLIPFGKIKRDNIALYIYIYNNVFIFIFYYHIYIYIYIATFSLFHALGYIRSNIIPTVFPTPRVPAGTNAPVTWQAKTQQRIKAWTDKNYSTAMRFVATVEINVIMPRLILGLLR